MWHLVQIAEYLILVAVLGRILPASTPTNLLGSGW